MPGSPYTDLDRPPLDARRLRRALIVPDGLWTELVLHTETGSTNADAAEAARSGAPEGLVVVAERQTAGRGRRGRSWESPARAGIAVSVLLRPGTAVPDRGWPAVPAARHGWLPLLAGVALVEAVDRLAELGSALKWPNDLLVWPRLVPPRPAPTGAEPAGPDPAGLDRPRPGQVGPEPPSPGPNGLLRPNPRAAGPAPVGPPSEGEAKCAGILAEGVATNAEEPAAVVLGVGLNVTLRADELPVNPTGLPATSLQLAGAVATDRDPLLRELLRGIERWYGRWRAVGGDARECGLHEAYVRSCATLGREVRVLLPGGKDLVGVATAIDPDGHLVLDTAVGERRVAAGEVLHLR
ncbi:biotin--[acetyl-CoA-carboxylase] ligase [Micromonospora sp. HM5-17]|jgi:BirA family biotin operon repressor/biotin-[acetyl-CoA-carboxylase] ligase|uniref:biotin--[acetyl-CoA-carboxylase] ligase n=1 Tax=Micromonospora sp. HM5-17 TaxID=2487710 RepID=UPI000F476DFD|nr:biotin--[acetyl-CoA-carboxylase] ligase [Micromonospora sp. HM5-17]ROT32570.1 biotin--[acetyl-CoA-carboxylase] ligase [Micromonospora sp. HM5-17]